MNNARPNVVGTGAVMAGGHGKRTATGRRNRTLDVETYRNTARLRGDGVPELLDMAGVSARMYDRALGCWTCPVDRVDEVLAVAEWRQRRLVTVREATR